MSTEPEVSRDLLREIADEGWRVQEEALYNYAGHNEEARMSDQWYRWLGVPTTLLAAAAGVTSFSSAAVQEQKPIHPTSNPKSKKCPNSIGSPARSLQSLTSSQGRNAIRISNWLNPSASPMRLSIRCSDLKFARTYETTHE